MEDNQYSLLNLNRELSALDNELAVKTREFAEYRKVCDKKRLEILSHINVAKHSLDVEKFDRGIRVLDLKFPGTRQSNDGPVTYTQIYEALVNDAKRDLASGASKLKEMYFGQKHYEGYDQRDDNRYGYGPRHGSIYQSIGLRNPQGELSDDDIEAALYVLENLDVQLNNLNTR